jgi:hypothetical protein
MDETAPPSDEPVTSENPLPVARRAVRPRRRPAAPPSRTGRKLLIIGGVLSLGLLAVCGLLAYSFRPPAAMPESDRRAKLDAQRNDIVAVYAKPADAKASLEFAPFLTAYAAAANARNKKLVQSYCDFDRMIEESDRYGLSANFNVSGSLVRRAVAKMAHDNIEPDGSNWWVIPADHLQIVAAEKSADGKTAAIYTRTPGPNDRSVDFKIVYYLSRSPSGQWRIYDEFDVNNGQRVSANMVWLAEAIDGPGGSRVEADLRTFAAVDEVASAGNWDKVLEMMELLKDTRLPAPWKSRLAEFEGNARVVAGDTVGAEKIYAAGLSQYPSNASLHWLRASLRMDDGNIEGAAEDIAAFHRLVGPDGAGLLLEAKIHRAAGRGAEADRAVERAGMVRPESSEAAAALAEHNPQAALQKILGQKAIPEAFAKALIPLRFDKPAVAAKLAEAFEAARPSDPRGPSELGGIYVRMQRYDDAAKAARRALDRYHEQGDDQEEYYSPLDNYLFAMHGVDRQLQAYRAMPLGQRRAIFRTLAEWLEEEIEESDDDDKMKESIQALGELSREHRENAPQDAYLHYVAGRQSDRGQDSAAAAGHYERALRTTADSNDARMYRNAWAGKLFKLERGLEAYERGPALGPFDADQRNSLFETLMELFLEAGEPDGMQALIRQHAAKAPEHDRLPWYRAEEQFLRKNYEPALRYYRQYCEKVPLKAKVDEKEYDPNFWQHSWARERSLRCLLRLNRGAECTAEYPAEALPKASMAVQALLQLAVEDVAGMAGVLTKAKKQGWPDLSYFYDDEDIGPALRSPAFAEVFAQFPPPAPGAPKRNPFK